MARGFVGGSVASREIMQGSNLSRSAVIKQINALVDEGVLVPTEPARSPRRSTYTSGSGLHDTVPPNRCHAVRCLGGAVTGAAASPSAVRARLRLGCLTWTARPNRVERTSASAAAS